MIESTLPLLGFAAYSGTGKTTLLKKLLPWLKQQGLRVGMIKHTHHRFEIDYPGKDSYELRQAGADQILIASSRLQAWICKPAVEEEPSLQALVSKLDPGELGLILVEGFKHESFPKIELYRPTLNKPLLYPEDPYVIGVASDAAMAIPAELQRFELDDHEAIGQFILKFCAAHQPGKDYARISA